MSAKTGAVISNLVKMVKLKVFVKVVKVKVKVVKLKVIFKVVKVMVTEIEFGILVMFYDHLTFSFLHCLL